MRLAAVFLLALSPPQEDNGHQIVLTHARVLTVSGVELADVAVIVGDGKILAIG